MSHAVRTRTPPEKRSEIAEKTGLDRFELNDKQSLVLDSWANEILFGGAKGGGKSFLMRFLFSLFCLQAAGVICYLFRRTYDDLWKNHMEGESSFPAMLAPYVNEGRCAIVRGEIRWWNGSRIFLNHLQLIKHVMKYQGQTIHAAGFDEATQFEESQYRYILGSVRLGGWQSPPALNVPEIKNGKIVKYWPRFPLILNSANPGGISHNFIKKRFIDTGPYKIFMDPDGYRRQFIPARAEDNPHLLKNDPTYLKRLAQMGDKALFRAMRLGDWNIVAGSMFGDTWTPQTLEGEEWHVCEPFAIPIGWRIWRGGDDGFANPMAVYWLTKDPDTGTIYIIAELYRAGLTPEVAAEAIKDIDLQIELINSYGDFVTNAKILRGAYDSNAFAQTGATPITRGDQMNKLGCNWTPVEKFPGSRMARVQNFHRMLQPNPAERGRSPRIVFFSTCPHAIETIPQIMRSDKNYEEVSDHSELHAFDGVTYGLQYEMPIGKRVRVGGI